MYILLVVFEEFELFQAKSCRFECHLEAMCGLRWLLDMLQFGSVNFKREIKRVLQPSFLPSDNQPGAMSATSTDILFGNRIEPGSLFCILLA